MGDSTVDRYAVIISTDNNCDTLENVTEAREFFEGQEYTILEANAQTERQEAEDSFSQPTLETTIEQVQDFTDDDDEVVFYVTGREGLEQIRDLDIQLYGQRTVIMDLCCTDSRNQSRIFLDDPSTLFISFGQSGSDVNCHSFASSLFDRSTIEDNQSSRLSWREQYGNAMEQNQGEGLSLLAFSRGYDFPSSYPFSRIIERLGPLDQASTEEDLDRALTRPGLNPGQYAVVFFSGHTVGIDQPHDQSLVWFREAAREAQGQYRFLRYVGDSIGSIPDRYRQYYDGHRAVVLIDHLGDIVNLEDTQNLLDRINAVLTNVQTQDGICTPLPARSYAPEFAERAERYCNSESSEEVRQEGEGEDVLSEIERSSTSENNRPFVVSIPIGYLSPLRFNGPSVEGSRYGGTGTHNFSSIDSIDWSFGILAGVRLDAGYRIGAFIGAGLVYMRDFINDDSSTEATDINWLGATIEFGFRFGLIPHRFNFEIGIVGYLTGYWTEEEVSTEEIGEFQLNAFYSGAGPRLALTVSINEYLSVSLGFEHLFFNGNYIKDLVIAGEVLSIHTSFSTLFFNLTTTVAHFGSRRR